METLAIYLLKSSALIALFYGAYVLFLRQETFFRSNRWFLLLGLITSAVLPLVTFTKTIWIEPKTVVEPIVAEVKTMAEPMVYESLKLAYEPAFEINGWMVAASLYGLGILILLFRLLFDLKQLRGLLSGKIIRQEEGFKYVEVSESVAPFSYFNYIVFNASLFDSAELQHILAHERVHCREKHSLDVLLARLFCIAFWYHPLIWLYKKAMMQNLEFIADSEALKSIAQTSEAKKSYQFTLLKVTTHQSCVSITNPFYQSLIKKRIVMLNTNQSKKRNAWKYFVVIPALLAFLLYFQTKIIAQEKQITTHQGEPKVSVVIDKNTTDEQLKKEAERLKKEHNVKLKFSKVKRNASGEITCIKVEYNDGKGSKGTSQYNGDEAIEPIHIYQNEKGGFTMGNGKVEKESRYAYVYHYNDESDDQDNDDVVVEVEAPEAPEAPEAAEIPEPADAPHAPAPPARISKKIIIKGDKNDKAGMRVIVNGETIDVDPEKIIAELDPMIIKSLSDVGDIRVDIDTKDINKITRDAMRQARDAMKRSRVEIRKSLDNREASEQDLAAAKKELEAAREEIKQARLEMEKSRAELEKLRAESKKKK